MEKAPLVLVPRVIPRRKALPCLRRDRIILPTLMLILPGTPPDGAIAAILQPLPVVFAQGNSEQASFVSSKMFGDAGV